MDGVRKILVPVDFSEASAEALKYAASLAQTAQAELVVLHAAQKKEADSFLESVAAMEGFPALRRQSSIPVDRLLREKALDLRHFIDKVVGNFGPPKITRRVALGDKAEIILDVVKTESIDLVVLPISRRSFFSYVLAGLKLLKVILKCPCPVVVKPLFGEPRRSMVEAPALVM